MNFKYITCVFFLGMQLIAEPPREMPHELIDKYTEGGTIPIINWYLNDSYPQSKPVKWTRNAIDREIRRVKNKRTSYYGPTDTFLYKALSKYSISGKSVAVIGSVNPTYEATVLVYGGTPTTIEYNTIQCKDKRITCLTVEEFNKNPKKFDAIISISSIEHDGLGRYGDPIDPYGDYKTMASLKKILNPGGKLYLAVPVGTDCIVWNAHRIYGKCRLPKLLKGWNVIEKFGNEATEKASFSVEPGAIWYYQPVFVLEDSGEE